MRADCLPRLGSVLVSVAILKFQGLHVPQSNVHIIYNAIYVQPLPFDG